MDVALANAPFFVVPLVALILLLEVIVGQLRGKQSYELKDTAASLSLLGTNIAMNLMLAGAGLAFYYWVYQFRFFDVPNSLAMWLLLVVVIDFFFYVFHRASHRVRVLWAIHINHHSSLHMNLGTGMRQALFGPVVRWIFFWPILVVGFDPLMFASAGVVGTVGGFWVHTEHIRKMPAWFEYVFNTPSHHRVHHGSNPQYIDKNYGNLLIIWDRMFGTFAPEKEVVVYGLTNNINSYNPLKIIFHDMLDMFSEIKRSGSVRNAVKLMMSPPGSKG